ncbi:MAG: hypothetical protein ACRCZP_18585 [Phycicoccus sp.]
MAWVKLHAGGQVNLDRVAVVRVVPVEGGHALDLDGQRADGVHESWDDAEKAAAKLVGNEAAARSSSVAKK